MKEIIIRFVRSETEKDEMEEGGGGGKERKYRLFEEVEVSVSVSSCTFARIVRVRILIRPVGGIVNS